MGALAAKDRPVTKPLPNDVDDDEIAEGGISGLWIAGGAVVAIGVVIAGLFTFTPLFGSSESKLLDSDAKIHEVKRGNLKVTITESGNLESAANVELKSGVPGVTSILTIVTDGTQVKKGEELVLLDSSELESQIENQEITVQSAEQARLASEKDFTVAEIAVKEYLEGNFTKDQKTIKSNIVIAEENLRSAQNALGHARRMARKGYITQLQLAAEEFSVERAQLELELRETELMVLEDFTKEKTLADLNSKKEVAESKKKSEEETYKMQLAKLNKYKGQLEKCKIFAPQDGMVVYANDMGMGARMGQQGPKIEEGAQVKEFQSIIKLPDLSKMQVKVAINESKIQLLVPRPEPYIASVKIQDKMYNGKITYVASQPEPGDWWGGSVKKFATLVRIEGVHQGLKPGMTAEVKIFVNEKKGVVLVPPQAVVERSPKKFCVYVVENGQAKRRNVELGATNDTQVEITNSLDEGELVLLNPRRFVEEANESDEDEQRASDRDASDAAAGKSGGSPGETSANSGSTAAPAASDAKAGDAAATTAATTAAPTAAPAGDAPADAPKTEGAPADAPKTDAPPADAPKTEAAPADVPKTEGAPANGAPGKGGAAGNKGGGRGRMPTWKELDKDKDGKVSKEEAPEWMQQFFDAMDPNGDGFLDKAEQKQIDEMMKQRKAKMKAGGGMGGPPQ